MGLLDETRFIERQQFFNGQRLFASDLQSLEAFHREMRWLHNQSLHQPGVGRGLAVSGHKGDRQVSIGPGYAIDAWGREIVLTQDRVEPVPPVAGEEDGTPVFYDLTVSYPDDADLEEAETRAGVCLPRGVVRLREEPVFCWVRLQRDDRGNLRATNEKLGNDIKNGLKIVVARAEVLNCQLNSNILIAQRRSARPAEQPYVACGVAAPVPWEAWPLPRREGPEIPEPRDESNEGTALAAASIVRGLLPVVYPVGLRARINTTGAGFRTTPYYSARINGPRFFEVGDGIMRLRDGVVNIHDPQPGGFTIDVLLMLANLLEEREGPQVIATALSRTRAAADEPTRDEFEEFLALFSDWSVVWMGVEG